MLWILLASGLLHAVDLPMGSAPDALDAVHFPDRLHAFVWRNWPLVPSERMAKVVGATPEAIEAMGRSMGLSGPPGITEDQWRRSYITIIRRNWHILPYEQLLELLDWTAEEMAYCLREDDFFFIKLGRLKPKCAPLRYSAPGEGAAARAGEIAGVVAGHFPDGVGVTQEPLFQFVRDLSAAPLGQTPPAKASVFAPRFCYSYFALYGDPLLEQELDPYPEGYLARLAASGVSGVWLQAVLFKLAPFPWDEALSEGYQTRLANLAKLVARAKKHGVGVYLYLNEPRSMPLAFFEEHPDLKGVVEGDWAAMCTSVPAVRDFMRGAVASICEAVPDLAGFFTISASENLTNCWSHHHGEGCPRCSKRAPAEVIAEMNATVCEGIAQAGTSAGLIAWDWGWRDDWVEDIVKGLPEGVTIQSVSEWSIPIERGGIKGVIGEYSLSEIGPGPRATRHWGFARARGLKTNAKIQANNTWELSPVPYVPVVENAAQHALNLRDAHVNGLMLSWTLGGYPSPNLEVVAEIGSADKPTVEGALDAVAERRFGPAAGPAVVAAWRTFSAAFKEYPFHISTVYRGPQQMGPANGLWEAPTGYASTMVGLPYDDLDGWRSIYPAEVFIGQFEKVADGFEGAITELKQATEGKEMDGAQATALAQELDVAGACAIHLRSVANQARFVVTRDRLAAAKSAEEAGGLLDTLAGLLESEIGLATRLYAIQSRDPRIGFEATNHYFYVPVDLAEKVVNCTDLLTRWVASERAKWGG